MFRRILIKHVIKEPCSEQICLIFSSILLSIYLGRRRVEDSDDCSTLEETDEESSPVTLVLGKCCCWFGPCYLVLILDGYPEDVAHAQRNMYSLKEIKVCHYSCSNQMS